VPEKTTWIGTEDAILRELTHSDSAFPPEPDGLPLQETLQAGKSKLLPFTITISILDD